MKIVLIVLCFLFLPITALAVGPYLICDAQTSVDNYVLYQVTGTTCTPSDISGKTPINTPYPLHYDLSGLSQGAFHFCVAAENVWGQSIMVPFGSTKTVPSAPANLRLSNQ